MKRLLRICVVALVAGLIAATAFAQQMALFRINQNDPLDRKAVVALRRGLNAAELDPHQVRLAITNQFNAFYCGQGLFVAGKPLLQLPQWAVDAVMAHEVGHFVHRHVEAQIAMHKDLVDMLGALGTLLNRDHPDDGREIGETFGELAAKLVMPKFSRQDELEADAYAVDVLQAEGYTQPGNVIANALALIERVAGPSGGRFFDTHPSFEDRIERLRGK